MNGIDRFLQFCAAPFETTKVVRCVSSSKDDLSWLEELNLRSAASSELFVIGTFSSCR